MKDNDIETYSTSNDRKSVATKAFIKTLKNKNDQHMIAASRNIFIDKLDDIINKYNNTYHRTIKMESTDVKDNGYIDYSKDVKDKDPKFKVGD